MNQLALPILSIFLILPTFGKVNGQLLTEEIIQTDTIQISPSIRPMVFKYYRNEDGYVYHNGMGLGRFDIYFLGSSKPFQRDTVDGLTGASYPDVNFDGIKDIELSEDGGANGGTPTDYYVYDRRSGLFELELSGLSDPEIDPDDSTVTSSNTSSLGRLGDSESYKLRRGKFIKIEESEYSENGSYKKQLINDILTTTERSSISILKSDILVDSSWTYYDGKLRLTDVTTKRALDHEPTQVQVSSGIAYTDVQGSFLYVSEETFEYNRDAKGKLTCNYTFQVVQNDRWATKKKSELTVKY